MPRENHSARVGPIRALGESPLLMVVNLRSWSFEDRRYQAGAWERVGNERQIANAPAYTKVSMAGRKTVPAYPFPGATSSKHDERGELRCLCGFKARR